MRNMNFKPYFMIHNAGFTIHPMTSDIVRPLNFAINSLNGHSRANGNPVPDQVEDKHFQLVMDSRFRGNDRKGAFFKALLVYKRGLCGLSGDKQTFHEFINVLIYRHYTTLFKGYSIIPSAPFFSSFGIRSLTLSELTTVSTENHFDW